jgi:hypothetical protein
MRKPRKTKPKPSESGKHVKNPWANKTEEQKAQWKANMLKATAGKQGRPKGLPDGMGAEKFAIHKAQVAKETKIIMEKIVDENDLTTKDGQYAVEALETAVTIMRLQGDARNKLGAAKLILEYTKSKPSAKTELTVNTAEDLLNQILADEA